MFNFTADPRDGYRSESGCSTCCCEPVRMRPGETNIFHINYAPWSVPIGGRGLGAGTQFEIEKKTPDLAVGGNQPPVANSISFSTAMNTALTDTIAAAGVDPESAALTFSLLPFFGAQHGELSLATNGAFTYTPNSMWQGAEHIFYQVSDGVNPPVAGELVIKVGTFPPAEGNYTSIVTVLNARTKIDSDYHFVEFPVSISPAAKTGDIYRMSVRQAAFDCDCNAFYHISCFDIIVGKC